MLFGIGLVLSIAGALALLAGLISIAVLFIRGVIRAIQDSRRNASPPDGGSPPPPAGGPSLE